MRCCKIHFALSANLEALQKDTKPEITFSRLKSHPYSIAGPIKQMAHCGTEVKSI